MGDSFVQNQCSSCGGAITDPNVKKCPHCGTSQDHVQTILDEKNKNIELCPNCGSPVIFNIEKQQFVCDFCHSTFTTKIEKDFDNLIYEADNLIPFQIPEGLAKKQFFEWLIKGENLPLDILGRINNIQLEQVFIPYMCANVVYDGAWGADIGYNRSESYTEYVTKEDKNGNKYSEPIAKTRTVVDWNHSSDIFSGTTFKSYLVNDELTGLIASFAQRFSHLAFLENTKPFDEHYTAGTRQLKISSYKVSSVLRSIRVFAQEEAEKKMNSILPGDENKNAKITKFTYNLTSKYTYVPFWKVTYKYEDMNYSAIMTAATKNKIEIDGNRPICQEDSTVEKKMRTNGRFGLLGSLLFFLINIFSNFPSEVGSILSILFLGGIGIWIYFAIKRHLFLDQNKKYLEDNLNEYPEYIKLLKQYPK
ncbi:zinc ribbon domain-containing protein [Enterococcus sp. AZ177]|uniref:zinc ribbon domain-containing protein n=1 Tax=unclassified Enterococcus TaxID=2608891 RepID=UPI003D2FE7D2